MFYYISYFSKTLPINGIFHVLLETALIIPNTDIIRHKMNSIDQKSLLTKSIRNNKETHSTISNNKPCFACCLENSLIFWKFKRGIKHKNGI
jgi:hypothetical protein